MQYELNAEEVKQLTASLDAIEPPDLCDAEIQFAEGPPVGDRVVLYRTNLFYTEDER